MNNLPSSVKSFSDFSGKTVLFYTAAWADPSQKMRPIVEEVCNEYQGKVAIFEIDVDANANSPLMTGVSGVPFFTFVNKEKVTGSLMGAHPKKELIAWIDGML